jgi:large subunit ribosomal protein L6
MIRSPLPRHSHTMIWRQLSRPWRSFSWTARRQAHTSHIGREPIKFSPNVTLNLSPTAISIKGPLGATSVPLMPFIKLALPERDTLTVAVEDAEVKKQRSMWGLTRTLINNAIIGITEGFSVPLYLVGVGYRAALEEDPRGTAGGGNGQRLNMKLGFSHPVFVPIPPHIRAEVPLPTKIVLHCTDKHKLGLFAAKVRKWRPPEPYKGKVHQCSAVNESSRNDVSF